MGRLHGMGLSNGHLLLLARPATPRRLRHLPLGTDNRRALFLAWLRLAPRHRG